MKIKLSSCIIEFLQLLHISVDETWPDRAWQEAVWSSHETNFLRTVCSWRGKSKLICYDSDPVVVCRIRSGLRQSLTEWKALGWSPSWTTAWRRTSPRRRLRRGRWSKSRWQWQWLIWNSIFSLLSSCVSHASIEENEANFAGIRDKEFAGEDNIMDKFA